jgi:uncharacterized protein
MASKSPEHLAGPPRIRHGPNPLPATVIHPHSYRLPTAALQRAGLKPEVPPAERAPALAELQAQTSVEALATELGTGVPTLTDIFEQLVRPGRDPREDLPRPILRSDVLAMEDLRSGMRLSGTVRNVVDFGAFIDVGVKRDGLLHRSKIPRPVDLSVGDVVEVTILDVDMDRNRISLGWPKSN